MRPESSFLRSLYGPLSARAREQIWLELRVAALEVQGVSEREMAERLGVDQGEIRVARKCIHEAPTQLETDH